jgi:hypothetical protein
MLELIPGPRYEIGTIKDTWFVGQGREGGSVCRIKSKPFHFQTKRIHSDGDEKRRWPETRNQSLAVQPGLLPIAPGARHVGREIQPANILSCYRSALVEGDTFRIGKGFLTLFRPLFYFSADQQCNQGAGLELRCNL